MYQIAKELAKKLGIDTSDLDPPHLSDVGNATMLRLLHGEALRYCWPWKCWLVWDDTRWKQDKAGLGCTTSLLFILGLINRYSNH